MGIQSKITKVLEAKSNLVKDLQYELARVVKAHNDMLKVFEAKMADWNVPVAELGFRPLVVTVNTNSVPISIA